jgi:hypothetical protein
MADFFPLISKAVASLSETSGESRQVLYDRVRAALLSELRAAEPPFSEFQIMHERLALEDAVRKFEDEAAATSDKLTDADQTAADADDTGISVEIPWTIVTGNATGRLDRVWRLYLDVKQHPLVQPAALVS